MPYNPKSLLNFEKGRAIGTKRPNCSGKNHWNWQGGKPEKVCEVCYGPFEPANKNDTGRFCSVQCRGIGYRGKSNASWRGGVTPLNKSIRLCGEADRWRVAVFNKDDYTCQKCGAKNGLGKRVDLEAHHLKSFSVIFAEFLKDYDQFSPIEDKETLLRIAFKYKPFWDIGNGMTLCLACHNKTKERL